MSEIKAKLISLKDYMETKIIGQEELVKKLLITLLADGHALVEGAPGLAKTKAIKTLSGCINAKYNRIQFTPDLLPADITGSEIYVAAKGEFEFRKGLEAMAERQVSMGGRRYQLPELFMVMATQNPIEHEGTYNLPEAQLDRFLMYIKIDQPDAESERKILHLVRGEEGACGEDISCWQDKDKKFQALDIADILAARQEVLKVHMSEPIEEYLVQLIMATRHPEKYDAKLAGFVQFGASPRATIGQVRENQRLAGQARFRDAGRRSRGCLRCSPPPHYPYF